MSIKNTTHISTRITKISITLAIGSDYFLPTAASDLINRISINKAREKSWVDIMGWI